MSTSAAPPQPRTRSLLLVGHGSHLSADSSSPVYEHAARIRARGLFHQVQEAFWKEEPALRGALELVEGDEVVVVPLFLAEGYFTRVVVPRELGVDAARAAGRTVVCRPPVGTHARMEELLLRRAIEACGLAPRGRRDVALVIIGHGTERHPTSGGTVYGLVERLRARAEFARVECGFLDESPRIEEVLATLEDRSVVLVPFFVADGWHTATTIPRDLGLAGGRTSRGRRALWYTPPVGTLPEVAELIVELAAGAGPSGEGGLQ